jgi:hypothetical protein
METIFRLSICLAALTASSRAADHERVFSSKVELLVSLLYQKKKKVLHTPS